MLEWNTVKHESMSSLIVSQPSWKKSRGNSSGLGAFSFGRSKVAFLISCKVNSFLIKRIIEEICIFLGNFRTKLLFWSLLYIKTCRSWPMPIWWDLDHLSKNLRCIKRILDCWLFYRLHYEKISCYCVLLSTNGFWLLVSKRFLLWILNVGIILSWRLYIEFPLWRAQDRILFVRELISLSSFCVISGGGQKLLYSNFWA